MRWEAEKYYIVIDTKLYDVGRNIRVMTIECKQSLTF